MKTVEEKRAHIQSRQIADEIHLMISPDVSLPFGLQLESLHQALNGFCRSEGQGYSPVFIRYFLSDAANQADCLNTYPYNDHHCATSMIEQPPLDGSKVAMWVQLMKDVQIRKTSSSLWEVQKDGYRHLWLDNSFRRGGDPESQMNSILRGYISALEENGCSLSEDCIRTWIYVQNIDVNYAGIVKARRETFDREGLTKDTHYIASTAIAGRNAFSDSLVVMDAYAVAGLGKGCIRHLYGYTHLNPTYEYGVTFERGTAVDYPDRRQVFISGTASIDNKGQIVHPGDARRQTGRLLENVSVLLKEAECGFDDVMSMIIYLRDIADHKAVREIFEERFPGMPKIYLWAPVCRPGWLVEMECIALKEI